MKTQSLLVIVVAGLLACIVNLNMRVNELTRVSVDHYHTAQQVAEYRHWTEAMIPDSIKLRTRCWRCHVLRNK